MSDFVRKIIEENIDAIEYNEWEEFFYKWCVANAHPKDEPQYYEELVQIFDSLHIPVDYSRAIPAVTSFISNFLETEQQDSPEGFIGREFLISKASQLDVDKNVATNIVETVTKELGLQEYEYHNAKGYTWSS